MLADIQSGGDDVFGPGDWAGANGADTGYLPAQGEEVSLPDGDPHPPASGIPGALVLPPIAPLGTLKGKISNPRTIKRANAPPDVTQPARIRRLVRQRQARADPRTAPVLTVGSTSLPGTVPVAVVERPLLALGTVTALVDPPMPHRTARPTAVALLEPPLVRPTDSPKRTPKTRPPNNSHGVSDGSRRPLPPTPLPDSDKEVGDGSGLKGEYYIGRDFEQYQFTRPDPDVVFFWGSSDSPSPRIPPGSDWTVRWTGKIQPRYSETYTFYAVADDGVRVWINHKLLVDDWTLHPLRQYSGQIRLEAGRQYAIRVDYFESGGPPASVAVYWESRSQKKEYLPENVLFYPVPGDEAKLALDEPPRH